MKSLVVERGGQLHFAELDMPKYNACQALVKMLSCGVCNGTDMKIIHGNFKNFDTYPAALGHEGVGEVVAVGDKVTSYKVGDKVLLPFVEETSNGVTPGWGAFSEYCVVGDAEAYIAGGMGPGTKDFSEGYFAQTVIKDTDKVDAVGASMIVTFREVLSAMRRFGFKPNENVVIFGAGPVGLCFTRFAKLIGMGTVVTIDVIDEKVEIAKQMGADYAFNSKKCDVDAEIHALFPDGVDYVVDAVGINALINQAMGYVKYNGKICCYGISPTLHMELDWSKAPYNWSLDFVQWPSKLEEAQAHNQVMAWINAGVLDPYAFISHVFDFADAIKPFELIEAKDPSVKKMIVKF